MPPDQTTLQPVWANDSPSKVRVESALAGQKIYDLTPYNGRDIVSNIVRDHNAIGGVNGDFFQWGDDPGGVMESYE